MGRDGDGVERWTLDRPTRRNALSSAMLRWIEARAAELHGEVVILDAVPTGEPRVFSAGADLDEVRDEIRAGRFPDDALAAATQALSNADADVVAAVDGAVIGAAVELLCACTWRIFTAGSTLRVPAARLGVVYHPAGLSRIAAVLGAAAARSLVLDDRVLHASAAAALGVGQLVEPSALAATALAEAARPRGLDAPSRRANRRYLHALASGPVCDEARAAHEAARTTAYAALRERLSSAP